jgi:hypothetical protein
MNQIQHPDPRSPLVRRIRLCTAIFIAGLVISGLTAIPLETELNWLTRLPGLSDGAQPGASVAAHWLENVRAALLDTNTRYPFIAYGGDWLAFGHLIIALAFVWAWREPVRNRWLFDFGLIACALVIPWAMTFGALRGIPWWWRLLDCSFGVLGAVPLWLARRDAARLATGLRP